MPVDPSSPLQPRAESRHKTSPPLSCMKYLPITSAKRASCSFHRFSKSWDGGTDGFSTIAIYRFGSASHIHPATTTSRLTSRAQQPKLHGPQNIRAKTMRVRLYCQAASLRARQSASNPRYSPPRAESRSEVALAWDRGANSSLTCKFRPASLKGFASRARRNHTPGRGVKPIVTNHSTLRRRHQSTTDAMAASSSISESCGRWSRTILAFHLAGRGPRERQTLRKFGDHNVFILVTTCIYRPGKCHCIIVNDSLTSTTSTPRPPMRHGTPSADKLRS